MSFSEEDNFDRLPDSLLLLIFNKILDVKALGRCSAVSRRFHSLILQVHSVLVRVDCVISDDDDHHPSSSPSAKPRPSSSSSSSSSFLRLLLLKPFQTLTQLLKPRIEPLLDQTIPAITHHSPSQVLKSFIELRSLRIELPSGELGIDDGVLLKWRANFGSTLDSCVILGASSVEIGIGALTSINSNVVEDNGIIPESFYTNGGLKVRVVWTISSLIAASARHYLLQPIISEHRMLESLILTDADGQGVLCMDKEQLEELRVKPLSASSASKRTVVPALNMRLWYAPHLELPGGVVMKGATLVAIRPSEHCSDKDGGCGVSDLSWVASAFDEPFGMAARMLVKRRTYCLEMNSF